jgi:hypothetical protein
MRYRIFRRASILGYHPTLSMEASWSSQQQFHDIITVRGTSIFFKPRRRDGRTMAAAYSSFPASGCLRPQIQEPHQLRVCSKILVIQPLPPCTRRILFYNPSRISLPPSLPLSFSLSENIKPTILQVSDLPLSLQIIPCILRPLDTFIPLVEATPTTN